MFLAVCSAGFHRQVKVLKAPVGLDGHLTCDQDACDWLAGILKALSGMEPSYGQPENPSFSILLQSHDTFYAPTSITSPSPGNHLRRDQDPFHLSRQVEKNEMADVIKIVFAAFINHAD